MKKYTNKEIEQIANEYADIYYNKDANPASHEGLVMPFIAGFKTALEMNKF